MSSFDKEKTERIKSYKKQNNFALLSEKWLKESITNKYMYNWSWLGRPIIQLPNDIIAFAELINEVKPDIILETGIAHGGSVLFSASMLALLDYMEAIESNTLLDPKDPKRKVIAVDIDIREHNLKEIKANPISNRIKLIEGSSISKEVINKVIDLIPNKSKVLVCLDSNHTGDHVLEELRAYAPLVSKNSYCIVMDTIIDFLPENFFNERPWGPGNSPLSAIEIFLDECKNKNLKGKDEEPLDFQLNEEINEKLLLTVSPNGFLKRI